MEALCLHFAADHLGMESLEQRLKLAYDARDVNQLQQMIPLTDDPLGCPTAARLAPPGLMATG